MKHWVQIATIGTMVAPVSLAAAQDDVAPGAVVLPPAPPAEAPPEAPSASLPAVGGEGRWVFDLLGGQLGGPATTAGGMAAIGGLGFVGPFTISDTSTESDQLGLHATHESTIIALSPSLDTFVTERFSVGGRVEAGVVSSSTVQAQAPAMPGTPAPPDYSSSMRGYTLGIAPRVGYAIPLSSSVALWPRIGAGYSVSHQRIEDGDDQTVMRSFFVESIVGVGLRVSKHTFFDVGPVLSYRRSTTDAPSGSSTAYSGAVPGSAESFGASVRASLRVDF